MFYCFYETTLNTNVFFNFLATVYQHTKPVIWSQCTYYFGYFEIDKLQNANNIFPILLY